MAVEPGGETSPVNECNKSQSRRTTAPRVLSKGRAWQENAVKPSVDQSESNIISRTLQTDREES